MSGIIEGYSYDIFISYRQKDNKYDGWVTEFVENLKREIEATFKEEIRVYFDINPHDGLLETYDVDASLKEKLKCLVFIPIISRTYCDPKSFAWENEFKSFVEEASKDQFGLKVKLPNGNVANRVLPVRIHELDADDIKLYESVLGGVIRGIEFIYKAPGVNRPLRSKEDKPHDNQNLTIYRDQINKIANGISDIIGNLQKMHEIPAIEKIHPKEPVFEVKPEVIREPKKKKVRKLLKTGAIPGRINFKAKKGLFLISVAVIIISLIVAAAWLIDRKIKIKWALAKALPQAEVDYKRMDFQSAFELLKKAEIFIPHNAQYKNLESLVSAYLTVLTEPAGVKVYYKSYSNEKSEWKFMGLTPIDSFKVPQGSVYQFRMCKTDYDTLFGVFLTPGSQGFEMLYRKLFVKGTIPDGMVHISEQGNDTTSNFFIDKYEVTNRQFKEFINKGGYQKQEYWKYPFVKDKDTIPWGKAITFLTDKTGRPGPATWLAGGYPDGQDDYPVNGVCWYEAAAFASFAGKDLPTIFHWSRANTPSIPRSFIIPKCNFNGKGPVNAGYFRGINNYGTYDMAGNVREWCFNEVNNGRAIGGGAWNDQIYQAFSMGYLPAFNRSEKNGFRCVKYINKQKIPERLFQSRKSQEKVIDFYKMKQVPDEIFQTYKKLYQYDKIDLNPIIAKRDDSNKEWIYEKVTFTTAYDNRRMTAFLYLPKNTSPPYQTVIFSPGIDAYETDSCKIFLDRLTFQIDFILKNGRAFMIPVYFGTFDRRKEVLPASGPYKNLQDFIKVIKDFKRSIDYLQSRPDIDSTMFCFYGASWGGRLGAIIPAVEDRLTASIILVSGFAFFPNQLPESWQINYVSHVKVPTLMLAGKYDTYYSLDSDIKPMFKLLGTPVGKKDLKVYESDHFIPYNDLVYEVLRWLDTYLDPVKK